MHPVRLVMVGILLLGRYAVAGEPAAPGSPPVTRKDLLTATLAPGTPVSSVAIQAVTLAPNMKAPLHLHPCPVFGTVTEGKIAFQIEGSPVRHLMAGDAFYEPAHVRVARFDNEGAAPAAFTAIYLLRDRAQERVRIPAK